MNRRMSQAGFGIIEGLVVATVVLIVIGAGWLTYKDHHHKASAVNESTSSSSQTSPRQTTSSSGQTAQPVQKYLNITQWGVELPLSSAISDAYYVVSKTSSSDADGLPGTVWLGLTSLTNASCNPANNNNGGSGAIGAILRIPPAETDAVTGQLLTKEYPNGITIGSYYYAYQSLINDPNNKCPQASMQAADPAFASAAANTVSDSTSSTTGN
jgi:hypothetical protein